MDIFKAYFQCQPQNTHLQGVPKKIVHQPAATVELMHYFFWDTLYVESFFHQKFQKFPIECESQIDLHCSVQKSKHEILSSLHCAVSSLNLHSFVAGAKIAELTDTKITRYLSDIVCESNCQCIKIESKYNANNCN